ncbi:MAG TPA: type III pantothenate kinase [Bdellovibrionales bacterium]|nr:type III pantothenate kinase [Bdellovibrionales bacterium]
MILCLDVGNTQIYGGVFDEGKIRLRFRRNSRTGASSDEIGVFLRSVLRENDIDPKSVKQVALCTVVPEVLHSVKNACLKYFRLNPFVLQAGVKTGLKVRYKNPLEVGPDRIANAIAGTQLYPGENLLIIDFGTATTFCAVTRDKEYLGGVIIAGLRISMEALESRTSRLPSVEIVKPGECLAKTTTESIQSGLYFGTLGQVKEIGGRITAEAFGGKKPKVIGTGGFASLFAKTGIFDEENPHMVLHGLHSALKMNT